MAPSIFVDYNEREQDLCKNSQKYTDPMGKTQKFSKGYSSGFVSDYRHAVETVAESEGLGGSGRVDTEMTASDDSCAPNRKCISLNVDTCDGFGIPLQLLSVSKMSRSEKKELKIRLKSELDQVRNLQKKFFSRFSNIVAVSSPSDIHSCMDGKKIPLLDNSHRLSESSSGQGKKKVPASCNGHSLNRGLSGRFQSRPSAPTNVPSMMLMKQCEALLKKMMGHQYGWVFNEPVDVVKLNIPDYFNVIKHPMDFGTVLSRINSGQYSSPWEFQFDARLTISNAMTYNPPENNFHVMALAMKKFFEQRWKNIEKKLPPADSASVPQKSLVPRETENAPQNLPSKKRKTATTNSEPVKRIMSNEEKHNLNLDLESLLAELPVHIIDFLRRQSSGEGQTDEDDEIEVDIDVLDHDALFALRMLVDDHLWEKQANKAKSGPCEIEKLNESWISNSLMHRCKGNGPIDEDVDIGGNDPPISSYPPVEIEKDTAHRTSKCSSSSSSSSDSGSSSSDSDTGSSSGSDSDVPKSSSKVNRTNFFILENTSALAEQENSRGDPHDGNQSVSGLDQLEQNPQLKPASVEADSRQEGESAPPKRNVSPDKHYRAAFMKQRFLDTILKAHEKALDQGEKGDPDKLRREREELERKQREEKARLQAEAKAAEDARRQAEAEAAAEARLKRELEREAARLALQQMEKTVEINENSQFLEDLEMLSYVPACHLPPADEMSPDHSPSGMGCFKLQGTNPLEQLGLFMKMDDEQEEEEELEPPSNVSAPANDVEEGEND